MEPIEGAGAIMTRFLEETGVSTATPPRRYLWTDAFAVCNCLALHRHTGDDTWLESARELVDQVHDVLGRHRADDHRTGWISGLSEDEGRRHPTRGGLRIGKPDNERGASEPFDEAGEWNRDGQYFHYLTQWMHALDRMSRETEITSYIDWAIELAGAAHAGFVRTLPSGMKRMHWKMSIDLTYPLVPAMGQHDPLDGMITYHQLQATATALSGELRSDLSSEIGDMTAICEELHLKTADPLGIGALLTNALKVARLRLLDRFGETRLIGDLLTAAKRGLDDFSGRPELKLPSEYRLAFRGSTPAFNNPPRWG